MKQRPKRLHHYVPRRYLRGFADSTRPEMVWRYEKGKPGPKLVPIASIAAQNDYYSFVTKEGGKESEAVENTLKAVEEAAATGFERLAKRQPVDGLERSDFALYVAFMLTRVPGFRDKMLGLQAAMIKWMGQMIASHEEGFRATVDWMERKTGERLDLSREEFLETVSSKDFEIHLPNQASLDAMMVAGRLYEYIYLMNWFVLVADGKAKFVTSDNPVVYDDPSAVLDTSYMGKVGVGLATPGVVVTFPLDAGAYMLTRWPPSGVESYAQTLYVQVSRDTVRSINRWTAMTASRYVFGPENSKSIEGHVQKFEDVGPPPHIETVT